MKEIEFQPNQSMQQIEPNAINTKRVLNSSNQTPTTNFADDSSQSNHITKNTHPFANMLGLHYMRVFTHYWGGVTDENLLKHHPKYEKMINSQYFWCQYLSKKGAFSVLYQIFNAQKGPLIFITIMSILMGVVSLFGAYYQRFLFWEHTEKDYHTSGWIFFAIIMTAAFVRFFLFNYLQSLANQIAINIRIHLQNAYVKCLINLPHTKQVDLKGLVYFNYFSSIEVIMMALKALPYFVSSIVIVFGIIAFVIDIVGWLGLILLGTTLFAFILQVALLYSMFHIHEHYAETSNERNSIWIFSTNFFIRLIESGMSSKFVKSILNLRKKQTNIDFKYTMMDGFIQILAQSAAFFTVFVFYLIEERYGHPDYKEIFECVVLFSVFKTPVKMMAYGLVFAMEMYGSAHGLQEMFKLCKTDEQILQEKTFPKYYSHRSTCWTGKDFYVIKKTTNPSINLIRTKLVDQYRGKLMIMVSKTGYREEYNNFIEKVVSDGDKSIKYVKIPQDTMILNESILSNITFGLDYDQQKFKKVLTVMDLQTDILEYQQKQLSTINQNYICAMDKQLVQKISIARALYHEVDVLFIYCFVGPLFGKILDSIKEYRNARNQVTFVSYELGIHTRTADRIVFMNQERQFEEGTYEEMIDKCEEFKNYITQQKSIKRQLTIHPTNKQPSIMDRLANFIIPTTKPNPQPQPSHSHQLMPKSSFPQPKQFPPLQYYQHIKTSYKNLFRFYNYNHVCAGMVLLIVLCIPPLVDLYMEIIVAESKDFFNQEDTQTPQTIHAEEHKITLRYGLAFALFFFMNTIKIVVLSVYLRTASYKIFKDLINRWMNSKSEPTVLNYHKKNGLDLERNLESIDIRTTTEIDIACTIIFEHLDVIVFASVSSLLFLAVGLPFLVINLVIVFLMVHYSRQIFDGNRQNRSKINEFIKKLIRQRSQVKAYNQSEHFFKKYTNLNCQDITYELNKDWLFEALTIVFELIIILMLMTVLIVSLTQFHYIHLENEAFLELSISFLIGFVNGGRLDLNIFRAVDRQVVGISCLWRMGEHHNHKVHEFKDLPSDKIETLEFDNFSVDFFNEQLKTLSVKFNRGQRVACVGRRNDPMRLGFLGLFRLFDKDKVKGGIRVNGIDLYEQKITRQCMQKYVHFISYESTFKTFGETVSSYIQGIFPQESDASIQKEMKNLWQIFGCEPMFGLQTNKQSLVGESMDCFRLLIAMMSKCQVLVIEHCLHQIDIQQRQKLAEWMNTCEISIIIELTSIEQISSLYSRKIYFQNGQIVEQS